MVPLLLACSGKRFSKDGISWMMKLYRFEDPYDEKFARAFTLGTWEPKDAKLCQECGHGTEKRVPPLIIEWQDSTDLVGDFTFPGMDDEMVVTDRIRRELLSQKFGPITFRPLRMHQKPKSKQSGRTKRVLLPYKGESLWELQPHVWASLNLERSKVKFKGKCGTCGFHHYKLPRSLKKFFVTSATRKNSRIFRIRELPNWFFCTEEVKTFVESQGCTNVSFELMGEIG